MSIGDRFRDAREIYNQHGKQSQRDVAKALTVKKIDGEDVKITYSYLSKIENERPGDIGYKKVLALADYYGVSPEWLLTGNGSPSRDVTTQNICSITGLPHEIVNQLISLNSQQSLPVDLKEKLSIQKEFIANLIEFGLNPEVYLDCLSMVDSSAIAFTQDEDDPSEKFRQQYGWMNEPNIKMLGYYPLSPDEATEFFISQIALRLQTFLRNKYPSKWEG